jgi:hypothetical protein
LAWCCAWAGGTPVDQAGGDHSEPEAEGERDAGSGEGGVEGGNQLRACQGARIGDGGGEGKQRAGHQQQDPAGLQPPAAQLPEGGEGRCPGNHRDERCGQLGRQRGRGAHEGANGVERIGGHRYDDEHGEQAVPATPAN